MASNAELVLYSSLTDVDRLEQLAKIGLDPEAIPTEEMRPVVAWALEQFFNSGRRQAPSRAALMAEWQTVIEDAEVELFDEDEEFDTTPYAIDSLKAQYVHYQTQTFSKDLMMGMAQANPVEKVAILNEGANELSALALRMQPRDQQVNLLEGMVDRLSAYEEREASGHVPQGMTFDLEDVDSHTYGIHPGELAVLAAGPKTGKSYFLDRVALKEAERGRDTVLFTLENSVDMTMDRIACLALGIDPRAWQRGESDAEDVAKVREWVNDVLPAFPGTLHVLMPQPGHRTMNSLVRQAQMMGAESLLIDQLTFVDHPNPKNKGRPEIIRDLMHELKTLISTGPDRMSCLLAHQINREGVKAAQKSGFLEMYHMAEGSEIERTADWVFGLYQSQVLRQVHHALLQILAARRDDVAAWHLNWRLSNGFVNVAERVDVHAND
jgi:hypothetical protein